MLIRLGHSPDPHDTLIFAALAAGRVDTRGLELEPVVEELGTLDRWALEGRLDVSTISVPWYPRVQDEYVLLPHGLGLRAGRRGEARPWRVGAGELTTETLVRRLALAARLDDDTGLDPGEWWLVETGLPLPLTITVARRALGPERLRALAAALRDSVDAAETLGDYRCDEDDEGRLAVRELLTRAESLGLYERPVRLDFVDS